MFPFFKRKILAPGEEEDLEFEEDEEEGGAGAGSPDAFPARVPGKRPNWIKCSYPEGGEMRMLELQLETENARTGRGLEGNLTQSLTSAGIHTYSHLATITTYC